MKGDWRRKLPPGLQRMPALYPTDRAEPQQRHGMSMLWRNSIISAASGGFYAEFVILYLLALGASPSIIGLRASINSAAALAAPLLGAWLVERTGRRKRIVLASAGGFSRIAILFMALIPFGLRGQAAVVAFVVLVAMQGFSDTLSGPAGNSLLADIVPVWLRGRYLGNLMVAQNVAHMAILPLAGLLVRQIGGLQGYQLIWFLAALTGFWATSYYARIQEPPSAEAQEQDTSAWQGFIKGWKDFAHDKRFVLFCAVNFVFNLGIGFAGPFFTVHMVEDLGFQADTIALLATITTPVNIIALRIAGELVDRHGPQRITSISMLLVPILPFIWIFARTPLHVGLVQAYGFLAWSGFRVATTPLILAITRPAQRSRYIAIYNTINSVASMIAPLVAGQVYAHWGFNANGILSAVGRGLGGILFLVFLRIGMWETHKSAMPAAKARRGKQVPHQKGVIAMSDQATFVPSPRLRIKYNIYAGLLYATCVLPFALLALIPELGWVFLLLFLAALLVALVITFVLNQHYYRSISYELGESEIIVRKGILTKSVGTVPYRAVTNLAIKRGPFDRWFGLGTIEVHTAGFSQQAGPEAKLSGLEDYAGVYARMLQEVRRHRAAGQELGVEQIETSEEQAPLLAQILAEIRGLRQTLERRG